MAILNFSDVLKNVGLDPKDVKLIRHALSDERFRECYKAGMAHEYTQHQKDGFSKGYSYWITFISDGGTYARLHSCYRVNGSVPDTPDVCPAGLPDCEAMEYRGEMAFFDLQYAVRWFSRSLRIAYIPGDVYFTPEFPSIVKSRLLKEDNAYSVILKLDKLRHFIFLNDPVPFSQKRDQAVFRGKIRLSRIREKFLQKYFGSSICDCGVVGRNEGYPEVWMTPKKTIREHLDYKFIMALEGNDVASNLKWVMSSNSIAVMTRPTCETWFMEGKLIPDYHYIEIKDDLSDLEEKLTYYINHPVEAEQIVKHAHEYVAQFFDVERERLISLLVMDKYFQMTGQNNN